MSKQTADCSDARLLDLLQADDGSDQFRESSQHVEQCLHCRNRLEELAAEPADWQFAKESLSSESPGTDETRIFAGQLAGGQLPWHRHATAWTDSMAQQILSPPSHPEMLGRIGRYEVERLIGVGGMGVVFKAFDNELNRPVAIKVLAPYLAGSGAARKRFAREARAAAAVVHEHVVAIHNVESDETAPFLVMQFVPGESLQQRIDREGPLDLCEILRIATQTAAGLAAAHAQGLVHRDVKPSNILLEPGVERALLTDFGLARASDDASLTHTGYHPGTPQYMSPEQARGETVDARSDLFSLGSVIYTMCTGRAPFRADSSYGILRRITDTEPRSMREVNSNIPIWLEQIVIRLHAKSPNERFADAEELHHVLEQCLAHAQQPTVTPLPKRFQFIKEQKSPVGRRLVPAISKLSRNAGLHLTSPTQPTSRSTFIKVGLVFVSLATVAAVIIFPRPNPDEKPDSNNHAQQASSSASESVSPISEQAETAWQSTAVEMESFAQDFSQFEAASQELWDIPNTQSLRTPSATSSKP